MRRLAPIAVLLAAAVLAGCGGDTGDLFAVERRGDVPDAALRLIVSDGGELTCGDASPRRCPTSSCSTPARSPPTSRTRPSTASTCRPGPSRSLQYVVHTPDGTVRFADDSRGQPEVTRKLAYFTRQAAQQVCGRPR